MNLDDFDGAVRTLGDGLALHPHGPYQRALAAAFVSRWDKLQQQSGGNLAARLDLHTRGQIYVKLGRWDQALDDLETALSDLPQNRQLHESLALVYAKLDKPRLGAKHAEIAQRLAREPAED